MATEYERLRLQVGLVDNASVGLANINRQLQALQRAGSSDRFGQQQGGINELLKATGLAAEGSAKNFEQMALRMGKGAAAFAAASFAAYRAGKDIKDFASGVRDTARFAEALGTSYARVKNISEQFRAAGLEGAKGAQITAQLIQTHVEATKSHSEQFQQLVEATGAEGVALVQKLRDQLKQADVPEDYAKAWKEFLGEMEATLRKNNQDKSENWLREKAADNERKALEIAGLDREFRHVDIQKQISKEEEESEARKAKRATDFANNWDTTRVNIGKITNLLRSYDFSENSPFYKLSQAAAAGSEKLYHTLEGVAQYFSGKSFWDYFKPPPGLEKFRQGGGGGGGGAPDSMGRALGLDSIGGGGGGGAAAPAMPQRFSGGGEGDEYGTWGTGERWRLSTNIEDHRRAVTEDTETREANTKMLRQVNDKIFEILHPVTGGAPSGSLIGQALGGAAAAAGGGGGGYGGSGSGAGGGAATPGGRPRGSGSSGGGSSQGYTGKVPQPPAATRGGRYPNIENVKASARDQLLKEGLSPQQAEIGANALTGQAIAESGLRSQFHDRGKQLGAAGGYVPSIYGADHARGQAMMRWMKENNLDPNDTANQSRWMAHELMTGGFKRSQNALRQPNPNQDAVADALTQEFEAPASRNSPGTLAERRRNARLASGVGQPEQKVQQPSAPSRADAGAGGNQPVMVGFKGRDNIFDEDGFRRLAIAKGYRPLVIENWEVNKAVEEAKEKLKGNKNFAVAGFSLGAQSARELLKDPEYREGAKETVIVAPSHKADLTPLGGLPKLSVYPDDNRVPAQGEGTSVVGTPHDKALSAVAGHVEDEFKKQNAPAGAGPPAVSTPKVGTSTQAPGDMRTSVLPKGQGADPRLYDIVKEASKNLPPGYSVEIFSGKQGRSTGTTNHPGGYAVDFRLYKDGKPLSDYQNNATYPIYQSFAHNLRTVQTRLHPELNRDFRWGGYFIGGPNPMDQMHIDINPHYHGQVGGGSWEGGANEDMSRRWHVKPGLPDPIPDAAANTPAADDVGKVQPTTEQRARTLIDENAKRKAQEAKDIAGTLKADVIAPPGTKVKIMGTGAFKNTELTRHFNVEDVSKAVKPPARPAAKEEIHGTAL